LNLFLIVSPLATIRRFTAIVSVFFLAAGSFGMQAYADYVISPAAVLSLTAGSACTLSGTGESVTINGNNVSLVGDTGDVAVLTCTAGASGMKFTQDSVSDEIAESCTGSDFVYTFTPVSNGQVRSLTASNTTAFCNPASLVGAVASRRSVPNTVVTGGGGGSRFSSSPVVVPPVSDTAADSSSADDESSADADLLDSSDDVELESSSLDADTSIIRRIVVAVDDVLKSVLEKVNVAITEVKDDEDLPSEEVSILTGSKNLSELNAVRLRFEFRGVDVLYRENFTALRTATSDAVSDEEKEVRREQLREVRKAYVSSRKLLVKYRKQKIEEHRRKLMERQSR
jgi:hypothetical protein